MEILPCEICNNLVPFEEYNDHIVRCLRLTMITGAMIRYENEPEDKSDEQHDHEISELSHYLVNNAQISGGVSLHDFINDHFNGVNNQSRNSVVLFNIAQPQPLTSTYDRNIRLGELIGRVEVGLTEKQINDVCFSSTDREELAITDTNICSICQEPILETIKKNENACVLACSHIYCDECIKTWLSKNKKCPVCMIDLEDAFLWGR